jgi:glycosyltransferase involved in cell wall biosynthesis
MSEPPAASDAPVSPAEPTTEARARAPEAPRADPVPAAATEPPATEPPATRARDDAKRGEPKRRDAKKGAAKKAPPAGDDDPARFAERIPGKLREEGLSVLIPAFEEEAVIEATIDEVHATLAPLGIPYEIFVIDDGSRDETAERARKKDCTVLSFPMNRGYGASLKSGIRASRYGYIAITDADGTYPIHELARLAAEHEGFDMVVGARTGAHVKIPFIRRPAKWMVNQLANYLSGYKIPDLNSGLRIFRRELAERFFGLFPEGFSFTTTITVSALVNGYMVKFLPINYFKRVGKSSISPLRDFLGFLFLVVRLVTYFKPLNVFMPAALVIFALGLAKAIRDLAVTNAFGVGSSLAMLTGVQLAFLGLLADLILRRTKL